MRLSPLSPPPAPLSAVELQPGPSSSPAAGPVMAAPLSPAASPSQTVWANASSVWRLLLWLALLAFPGMAVSARVSSSLSTTHHVHHFHNKHGTVPIAINRMPFLTRGGHGRCTCPPPQPFGLGLAVAYVLVLYWSIWFGVSCGLCNACPALQRIDFCWLF